MSPKSVPANAHRQVAQSAAGEAIEALLSAFWADSFNAEGLEAQLAETIYSFVKGARWLSEMQPSVEEACDLQSSTTMIQLSQR